MVSSTGPRKLDAERRREHGVRASVVQSLGNGRVFEQRAQFGRERRRRALSPAPRRRRHWSCVFFSACLRRHRAAMKSAAALLLLSPAPWAPRHRAQRQNRSARGCVKRGGLLIGGFVDQARQQIAVAEGASSLQHRREFKLGEKLAAGFDDRAPASPSRPGQARSGTWQSMVTSSFDSSTASRFCSSDSR